MIFEQLGNTIPIGNLLFMATKVDSSVVTPPVTGTPQDFSYCAVECPYVELALSGSNDRENDKSAFLIPKLIAADTIVYKIKKNGTEVATITDNTYGTFYAAGSLTGNPSASMYVGFEADWNLIYAALGAGLCSITAYTRYIWRYEYG